MADKDLLSVVSRRHRTRAEEILQTLRSFFLEMPKGDSFLDRDAFAAGYQAFKDATRDGKDLSADAILEAIKRQPEALVAFRAILGVSPPEAAYLAEVEAEKQMHDVAIGQGEARAVDACARRGEELLLDDLAGASKLRQRQHEVVETLVRYLAPLLKNPVPPVDADKVHRLDKFDTAGGKRTLRRAIKSGVAPYDELLYERALGRPYASHRDSVSGKVGELVEDAIEDLLERHQIDGRKTRYRERVETFDQAPDFLIPSEAPEVVIEAKLTEDDGTARDKVSRVMRLRADEDRRAATGEPARKIVAVIDGRGFGQRPRDLDDLLRACDGAVYTLEMLDQLVAKGGPLHPYRCTRRRR